MAMTPGPWHYDNRRWIRDAQQLGVLRVQIGADPDNVRCAAAGPEMLAALKALEPYLDAIVCYASTMAEHEPNRIAHAARAAIAAAEPAPALTPTESPS